MCIVQPPTYLHFSSFPWFHQFYNDFGLAIIILALWLVFLGIKKIFRHIKNNQKSVFSIAAISTLIIMLILSQVFLPSAFNKGDRYCSSTTKFFNGKDFDSIVVYNKSSEDYSMNEFTKRMIITRGSTIITKHPVLCEPNCELVEINNKGFTAKAPIEIYETYFCSSNESLSGGRILLSSRQINASEQKALWKNYCDDKPEILLFKFNKRVY